jgi:hypothetical protein
MAGIKSFMLPVLIMIMIGAGTYIFMEMRSVNEEEIETVGGDAPPRRYSAGGNTRGAGQAARQEIIELFKPGYMASIKKSNQQVTKKLGEGYPESWPLMDVRYRIHSRTCSTPSLTFELLPSHTSSPYLVV